MRVASCARARAAGGASSSTTRGALRARCGRSLGSCASRESADVVLCLLAKAKMRGEKNIKGAARVARHLREARRIGWTHWKLADGQHTT